MNYDHVAMRYKLTSFLMSIEAAGVPPHPLPMDLKFFIVRWGRKSFLKKL